MSIPLLLPCPPVPLHSTTERTKGTSSLLHLGPFGSCQRPSKSALSKSPLLKNRKRSTFVPPIGYIPSIGHIPVTGGHNPNRYVSSFTTYSVPTLPDGGFIPTTPSPSLSGDHSLGIVLSSGEVNFSNKPPVISPLRESNCISSTRSSRFPSVNYSGGFSPTAESVTSISSQSQYTPTSPTFPTRVNDVCNYTVKNKFFPSSPTHSFTTSSTLPKSQSALIMPSLFTFFRSDSLSPQGGVKQNSSKQGRLPRDSSSRSLNVTSRSPSPLIRKCHTVISLSSQGNQPYSTNAVTNSSTQKKQKKLGFFRRISPSKSAIFSSQNRTKPNSTIRKSTSAAFSLGQQRSRKTSVSMLPHGELGMWPHKEHPEEEEGARDIACADESKDHGDNLSTTGGCSRCTSVASLASRKTSTVTNPGNDGIFCRLCLTEVSVRELYQLQLCQCRFCTYCMCMYATLKIREGEPIIECPDSNCDCRGELTIEELDSLVGKELVSLHLKFRRDREVDLDPLKTWCPRPGCETVVNLSYPKLGGRPQYSCCHTCSTAFCTACSSFWHPGKPCLRSVGCYEVPLNDCIKRCPRCKVPIERDAGCAQMQCKKCKHVFCWYCLASLEDDFLLRHYDKGPCKNKLGHSRASVLLHRAQVVVIFAGFGLLLIIASPLLLFVGPCLLCKSCRSCSRPDSDEDVSNV